MFYPGSWIRNPKFFILDPGGKKAPGPSVHKKDEKWIRNPEKNHPRSRSRGVKKHQIPDLQH
jgi:hypothetical protein